MKLSMNWLSDFVDLKGIGLKEYCDKMTDTGSKVEGYELFGEDIENVVVGRITKLAKHENSDHLQICTLDLGHETRQIVTGAQNVFEGAIVPVAKAVAKLPGGVVIKPGKLRGVESDGMLCSISELNLTTHDMPGAAEDGILILDESFGDKLGMDIREALLLRDACVEFEITSNRPDCLSVIGLARESAVSFGRPFHPHTPKVTFTSDGDTIENYLSVKISDPELCSRYTARVVRNVKIAPSPLWLRMRLRASGIRPINNIVDITNYVMLEYGQPMHAFDYKCLDGASIDVRRATPKESFKSLDDKDHVLEDSMLVIADQKKAVALAGVMGGANSEITDATTTVVFESACFLGASVRITAKKLGMRTDSSARFEKGLDCENTLGAIDRACELITLLGAGETVEGTIDVYPVKKKVTVLPLEVDRINRFLGVSLTEDYMADILRSLDFKVEDGKVYVPSFRDDIGCMNDIAEEILRIYGYNTIRSSMIRSGMTQGGRTRRQGFEVECSRALCGMGLSEIQTFSFISPKYYDKIRLPADSPLRQSIVISNPLGEDTSVMRTTAIPSMLETLARNNNFNNENVALYEMATVYIPNADAGKLPEEKKVITLGMYGDCDFYKLKGVCENLFALSGLSSVRFEALTENPTFHPGRTATATTQEGKALAVLGQVHPETAGNYGMNLPVYVATIDFDLLFSLSKAEPEYRPLPKFPASTRDYSFVCEDELEVGHIEEAMATAGGKLVESIKLFDVYRGPQVGVGKKSVSMRVILRAPDRTLTVEEADKVSAKIVKALSDTFGISLRA